MTGNETAGVRMRLFTRMKKILFLSAILLGTAVASRAGVGVHIGLPLPPLPPLPNIVIGAPAPRVVVREPRVFYPPVPVVVAPRPVCGPPVVVVPRRRVVYAPYWGHSRYSHGCGYEGHHHYR